MKKINGYYVPGYIYQLGVSLDGVFYEFYVGETTEPHRRFNEHKGAAKAGKELLVYDFMRQLNHIGQETIMIIVDRYGANGPEDKEDEHIMNSLLKGAKLQNMQKGSQGWMNNMIKIRDQMIIHKFTSLRLYKVWDAEQKRIENEKRLALIKPQMIFDYKSNTLIPEPKTVKRRKFNINKNKLKAKTPEKEKKISPKVRELLNTIKRTPDAK